MCFFLVTVFAPFFLHVWSFLPSAKYMSLHSVYACNMHGKIRLSFANGWKCYKHRSSQSNQMTQPLLRVTKHPKSEITNCFIYSNQLKTVKSQKVIWCLGCLSSLSAHAIIVPVNSRNLSDERNWRLNIFPVKEQKWKLMFRRSRSY